MASAARHKHIPPPELLGFPLPKRRAEGLAERDADRVIARLNETPIDWSLFGAFVVFDPRGYVRHRLYRDADWEMLLLCWLPGQGTAVHDHGGAWGAVRLLMGELKEWRYRWRGEGKKLSLLSKRVCGDEAVLPEPLDTVHRNENASKLPAVSLHLYSPPLSSLYSYDAATGARHVVRPRLGPSAAVGGDPRLKPGHVPAAVAAR